MTTFGFIGLGNMGGAIVRGMRASEALADATIYAYNPSPREADVTFCESAAAVAQQADALVLAVKPQVIDGVMAEIAALVEGKLVISVAAGKTIAYLQERMPGARVVRVMPNINAQVLAATSAYACSDGVTADDIATVEAMFGTVGTITRIDEANFSAFTAVASSSPAFSYMYIAALAEAGTQDGLPADKALEIAASAAIGSARMLQHAVLDEGRDPQDLVRAVCSPGGMTIEGVNLLRERGFEPAVRDAIAAAIAKDKQL